MAGYATPAWANDQSPAIDDSALLDIGHGIEIAEHPYGVCSTAAATAAKEVTIDYSGTLTLFTGLTVRVKFSNANTAANPTLNVNSTGAAPIVYYGTTAVTAQNTWTAGVTVTFSYDGTNWVMDALPESVGLLNEGIQLYAGSDLDNVTQTGWYYWNSTPPTHSPDSTSYCAVCVDHNGTNIRQTVYRGGYGNPAAPAEWVRYKYSSNAWTPWVQQVTQMLAADLSLYVNATSGNDSNDGLTAATAVKTISHALELIPHEMSGRQATIYLAAGTYANTTILGHCDSVITLIAGSGVQAADVIIPGMTVDASNRASAIFINSVTFTGEVSVAGQNSLSPVWIGNSIFNGAGLLVRGPYALLANLTISNAATAITVQDGFARISGCTIANTCTNGIVGGQGALVSVFSTNNNATTAYKTMYSGRIFVGGRTYHENPSIVTLFQTQTSLGTGTTDITISDDYRKYTFLEFLFSKNSSSTRAILYIHSNSIAVSAWYPIAPGGTVVALRISNVSGTYTQVRISNLSAAGYYLEAINAIP